MGKWVKGLTGEYFAYFIVDILDILSLRAEKQQRYRGAVVEMWG